APHLRHRRIGEDVGGEELRHAQARVALPQRLHVDDVLVRVVGGVPVGGDDGVERGGDAEGARGEGGGRAVGGEQRDVRAGRGRGRGEVEAAVLLAGEAPAGAAVDPQVDVAGGGRRG